MRETKIELFEFRAAYFAAGPGVDAILGDTYFAGADGVGDNAGRPVGETAELIADMNVNFAIVPFDLGFDPENAKEQRAYFAEISPALNERGIEPLALVTPSSYVESGSFKNATFAARLPNGKRVYYSPVAGRVMACWNHPEWRERMKGVVADAMGAGAAGVFFDFVCFGAVPLLAGGRLEGAAGCHCGECRKKYSEYAASAGITNHGIPKKILIDGDEEGESAQYARWRAGCVSETLDGLMGIAREKDSDAITVVSVAHLTTMPTLPAFGLDPEWALSKPDVCCVEHHTDPSLSKRGLTYEAPAFKALYASSRGSLPAALGYPYGPGPDVVRPAQLNGASLASGFSSGVSSIVRVSEYRGMEKDGEIFGRDFTDPGFEKHREMVALLYNWLEKNWDIYETAEPASRVGLAYSWRRLQWNPRSMMARNFQIIIKTLTEVQVPVKTIIEERLVDGTHESDPDLKVIIIPWEADGDKRLDDWIRAAMDDGKRIVFIGNAPDWADEKACSVLPPEIFEPPILPYSRLLNAAPGRWLLRRLYGGVTGQYGGFPLSGRAGAPPVLLSRVPELQCRYQPPKKWEIIRETIIGALGEYADDPIIEAPPYIHVFEWKRPPHAYFHVINVLPGFPGPDAATLKFKESVVARTLQTHENKIIYHNSESTISVQPQPYVIIEVKNRYR